MALQAKAFSSVLMTDALGGSGVRRRSPAEAGMSQGEAAEAPGAAQKLAPRIETESG